LNRERSNLIGWQQTLTTSPANHIRFVLVRANKFAKWKTSLTEPKDFDSLVVEAMMLFMHPLLLTSFPN
jgi:hypothetical protein